ncbi:MAG TPA: aminotransferase class V-fold PLP-dependent enzyme [Thermoanaerobaculia bacterium]|nr:aminotransferase class V-fold PLP-dependent enzyme [Thermoanaerobaculia bacterium]
MSERIDLTALRAAFPVTESWVYLNHAGIGPLSRGAAARMGELAGTVAGTGDRRWPERNDECERVRRQVARLLGARAAHEVAFVGNTSEGLSAVAWGVDWRPGDNAVGPEPEFPSDVYPWMALAPLGVEYRRVPERDGRVEPADLVAAIDSRTRVVAVSWVQYASGHRLDLAPLREACDATGALLVVDAIQGVGALAFDVEAAGADVCALASHKWLLGPEGLGILYVSDRAIERLRSTRHGWRSVASRYEWVEIDPTPAPGALRFEAGTLNVYGIHGLGASVDLLLGLGIDAVEARVLALAERAARGRAARGVALAEPRRAPGETSGIVAATHPGRAAEELAPALADRNIVVAARAGRLRAAPHVYNTEEEIDHLLAALDELL